MAGQRPSPLTGDDSYASVCSCHFKGVVHQGLQRLGSCYGRNYEKHRVL